MDKAQARILTLVLIAVLFIGQALYDFIKKNRSRSTNRPRQTISKPRRHTPSQQRKYSQTKTQPKLRPTVSELAGLSALESEPSPTEKLIHSINQEQETHEPDSNAVSQQSMPAPTDDELRKAVIWSEILKRKF
ncbi:MAG: hypothetical protein K2J12_01165 [Muribaculaceae bacterium]|nr:hypothetical protein [Muribaculaceae bacterium]